MVKKIPPLAATGLQLWGGFECTINRVGNTYFDQAERNGHASRTNDVARACALGVKAIRYPLLWERFATGSIVQADWMAADRDLATMRAQSVTVIAGLVHHGSGPPHTSLIDPGFAEGLAEYAGVVAARYPWLEHYTPVNEVLTTARFSCLYGLWYPHARDDRLFVQALLNQCRAVVLSMRAIRKINPAAKLVQTDDLGKTSGTAEMADVSAFYNARRWLGWDLLCGKVDRAHPLWAWLTANGAQAAQLLWFVDHRCAPDIVGINYYVTSDRWLDHRVARYPAGLANPVGGKLCVDTETVRVAQAEAVGIGALLDEAWDRYRLPIAITEAHIGAGREDQLRWLQEIWRAAQAARERGIDLRAVTSWALFGSHDWDSLVTRANGHYEAGAFDTRATPPRPTAVAGMLEELAANRAPSHPALQGRGWWRRVHGAREPANGNHRPMLISGASGTLGQAFARLCTERDLPFRLLSRAELDIANESSVNAALDYFRPWAVVNASGYVLVDEAEHNVERCFRENAIGPAILAAACARRAIHLTTFSSDLVFSGSQSTPYAETDAVGPLNVYGRSKASAEVSVLRHLPAALVVRTSAFFGPWDRHNFLIQALSALRAGDAFTAIGDATVSPTYVPDLANACLDLILDFESGIWHLTNDEAITWVEFARRAALLGGIDSARLETGRIDSCAPAAARPRYSAMTSSRARLLPPLDHALIRFLAAKAA